MDSRPVDDAPHDSTEGIYLPDNMAFSDSADGRITGHLPDKIEIDRHKRCLAPETSRSRSRLTARVPRADNDHIKSLVEHNYCAPKMPITRI